MMGELAAFLSSVTWATGSAVYSRLSSRYSAYSVNYTRGLLALPLFACVAAASGGLFSHAPDSAIVGWLVLSVLAGYGIGDALFFESTRLLGVPGALAIASVFPVWNAIVGAYFRNEMLRPFQWLGLFITLAFVILVILTTPQGAKVRGSKGSVGLGVFLAVITSIFWMVNSFSVAQAGQGIDPFFGNTIRMASAVFFTQLIGWIKIRRRVRMVPLSELRSVGWIFIFEAFGGSVFFLYGLSHTRLAVGSTLASLAPVLSVPIAWILKTEKASGLRLMGVSGVVFGLWMLVSG